MVESLPPNRNRPSLMIQRLKSFHKSLRKPCENWNEIVQNLEQECDKENENQVSQ